MIVSCSQRKDGCATIGPLNVWKPPSSTMTMPSIERETQARSGEIVPLANANSAAGQRRRTFPRWQSRSNARA